MLLCFFKVALSPPFSRPERLYSDVLITMLFLAPFVQLFRLLQTGELTSFGQRKGALFITDRHPFVGHSLKTLSPYMAIFYKCLGIGIAFWSISLYLRFSALLIDGRLSAFQVVLELCTLIERGTWRKPVLRGHLSYLNNTSLFWPGVFHVFVNLN